jgi:hypothetical protein
MNSCSTTTGIPRVIWIFWWQGFEHAPDLVHMCVRSWRQYNPTWEIVLLDRHSVFQHLDTKDMPTLPRSDITIQKAANIIRINLLDQHGGIWVDATCFCTRPLDDWLPDAAITGFFAFANPGRARKLANWFLVSRKEHPLISSFTAEHNKFWSSNTFERAGKPVGRIIDSLFSMLVSRLPALGDACFHQLFISVFQSYPYFIFHYHFAFLLKRKPHLAASWENVPKISAQDAHQFQRLAIQTELNHEARELMDNASSPVQKLSWKIPERKSGAASLLDYLGEFLTIRS